MKPDFATISSIEAERPETWQDHIFLTFDMDWAADEILADTIELVERADASATWFVTHDTPLLERLRANPKMELGIHPNFNFLLYGDFRNGASSREVIDRLMTIVPEATAVRSHSITQSSVLLNEFKSVGVTHDVNYLVPSGADIFVRPWRLWNQMVRVPYIWEDDMYCLYQDTIHPELEPAAIVADALGGGGSFQLPSHPRFSQH